MVRTASPGRLLWQVATVEAVREESASARTLVLRLPDWPGHLPGQHVDVRLTAPDGYSAQRSYSLASSWRDDGLIELTVQRVEDGEVSSYLTDGLQVAQQLQLRGPVGGWFVWRNQPPRVLLLAGGSGVVPLMAMIRARADLRGRQLFRLVYSVRTPQDTLYAAELARRGRDDPGLDVHMVYTRQTPPGWLTPPARLTVATLNTHGWPPDFAPDVFICGPTPFVEVAADLLLALGHDPQKIRTERFGGTA